MNELECPQCGVIRSYQEIDWGCACCGYQEGDPVDYDEFYEDDPYLEDEYESED